MKFPEDACRFIITVMGGVKTLVPIPSLSNQCTSSLAWLWGPF